MTLIYFFVVAFLIILGVVLVLSKSTLILGIIFLIAAAILLIRTVYIKVKERLEEVFIKNKIKETLDKCKNLTVNVGDTTLEKFCRMLNGKALTYKKINGVAICLKFGEAYFEQEGTITIARNNITYSSLVSIKTVSSAKLNFVITYSSSSKSYMATSLVFDDLFYDNAEEFYKIIRTICELNKAKKIAEVEARKKADEEQKRQERQEKMASLSIPEHIPDNLKIAKFPEFTNDLEKFINQQMSQFIAIENNRIKLSAHINWLKNRQDIQKEVGLEEDAKATAEELIKTQHALAECIESKNSLIVKEDELLNLKLKYLSTLKKKYYTFCKQLKMSHSDAILKFFQHLEVGFIQCNTDQIFILHLLNLYVYDKTFHTLRFVEYKNLNVQLVTNTEFTDNIVKADKIIRLHYTHENKNGEPDRRYNDNSVTYEVLRGTVIFRYEKIVGKIDFENDDKAILFINNFKSYCQMLELAPYAQLKSFYFANPQKLHELDDAFIADAMATARGSIINNDTVSNVKILPIATVSPTPIVEATVKQTPQKDTLQSPIIRKVIKSPMDNSTPHSLSELSEDEKAMILERRKQIAKKEKEEREEKERLTQQAKLNFYGENPIEQVGGSQIITNYLFSFTYRQTIDTPSVDKYEMILVDDIGKPVSNVQTLERKCIGSETKVSFKLLSAIPFDSAKTYYMLIKDANKNVTTLLGKFQYKINISFMDEF